MATDRVEVSVVVDDDHMDSIDDVARALTDAGFQVEHTLKPSGVITGVVEDLDLLDALSQVDGVATVERVRTIQLPPPEEDVQ